MSIADRLLREASRKNEVMRINRDEDDTVQNLESAGIKVQKSPSLEGENEYLVLSPAGNKYGMIINYPYGISIYRDWVGGDSEELYKAYGELEAINWLKEH